VRYRCLGSCRPAIDERRHDADSRSRKHRFFREHDLKKIDVIAAATIPHWTPANVDLWGVLLYRLQYKRDFRPETAKHFADLYSKRNLWACAALASRFTSTSPERLGALLVNMAGPNISRQRRHRDAGGGAQSGTYYIPPVNRESRVGPVVTEKFRSLLAASAALAPLRGPVLVSCEPSQGLALGPSSLDYVFTDPAYVDKVQYGSSTSFGSRGWASMGLGATTRSCESVSQ